MPRNPNWVRDELILALDLYFEHFRFDPSHVNQSHPKVIELSELLRQLPLHADKVQDNNFRNPNGIYMKLGNFQSLDPNYKGKGLAQRSKGDEDVWNDLEPV